MASSASILFTYPPTKEPPTKEPPTKEPPTKEQHIENVRTVILEGSGLKQEWIDFIKDDPELYSSLRQAVKGLVTYYTGQSRAMIPSDPTMILAALKYCKPVDVKVIILGHDPVKESDLATGLAFSFPDGVTSENISSLYRTSGISVVNVHEALKKAEITPGDSLNHEHWARKGVLLLNACLTLDPKNNKNILNKSKQPEKWEKPHFQYWEKFTTRLVIKLLREKILETPIFVLCWGTHAEDVGEALLPQPPLLHAQTGDVLTHEVIRKDNNHEKRPQSLKKKDYVVYIGNHPTFEFPGSSFSFDEQAPNQFRTIEHFHPGLFGPRTDVIDELAQGVEQASLQ